MNVIFSPKTQNYLDDLIPTLYKKGYFGFEESAVKYVHGLIDEIRERLPLMPHKPAPPHFDRYGKGMYYAVFHKNRETAWYAFFTKYDDGGETVYLVRYIANNHVTAQLL